MRTKIYHITHLENLQSILEAGGLLPNKKSKARSKNIAYPHLQSRRARIRVPLGPKGTLHDYVPFYFSPRPPMLYALHHPGPEMTYRGGQRPILHLVSSVQAVVQASLPFVFTDRHAVSAYANFYDDPNDLARLDWAAIGARRWRSMSDPSLSERKQAEFLVYGFFPWKLVQSIGVHDKEIAKAVFEIIGKFSQNMGRMILVQPDWYY